MAQNSTRVYTGAIVVLTIAAIGSMNGPRGAGASQMDGARWYEPYRNRESVTAPGVLRDFYKRNQREMDPDFDNKEPAFGRGQYIDILRHRLDADGKPVFAGGGYKVDTVWLDGQQRPIIWPKSYIAKLPDDHAGASKQKVAKETGFAVTPEEDIASWWRDVEGVNESYEAPITFVRGSSPMGNGVYTFDSLIPKGTQRQLGLKKGEDDMLGLIATGKFKKKRYSYECNTTFIHEKGSGWWLTVSAMDDVWVYIDGRLVIDLGGAYKGKEKRPFGTQTICLDRLEWLADGGTYALQIFMVDRDRGSDKSHLKVQTNIQTLNLVGPAVPRGLYD